MAEVPPQDMQVHSTYSDGKGTIASNIAAAEARGLRQLGCVDHVRRDTAWVPEYVVAVNEARLTTTVELQIGVEAKLLDTDGTLDLPPWADLEGVEAIYAADHQVPSADGPVHPDEAAASIREGRREAAAVVEDILVSTTRAVARYENVVIAHLFSVLPKIGVDEADVPLDLIETLAETTARSGNRVEVNERYRTPSARTLRPFVDRGLTVLASTDSHASETIGVYDHVASVLRELG